MHTAAVFSTDSSCKVKPSIIFRGKGKISQHERDSCHKSVHVYWQDSAWADTSVCVAWAHKTLDQATKNVQNNRQKFWLFVDNLEGQTSTEFREAVSKQGGIVWYGSPGGTRCVWQPVVWQPVDAGYGKLFKSLIAREFHSWMDSHENADLWTGACDRPLTARERRTLLTI